MEGNMNESTKQNVCLAACEKGKMSKMTTDSEDGDSSAATTLKGSQSSSTDSNKLLPLAARTEETVRGNTFKANTSSGYHNNRRGL